MGQGFDKFAKAIEEKKSHEFNKVLEHVRSVCDDEYDALLAQEHKTWDRAWQYVTDKARKQAHNGCAMIDDETVYGWFDEYVGLDDKAECEKKAKEEQERKERARETKQTPATTPTAAPSRPAKKKDDGQMFLDFGNGDDEEDAGEEEED